MTVPSPTIEYPNLTDPIFTPNGSPVVTDGIVGPANSYEFDGIDDWLSSSEIPITSGQTGFSIGLWINNKGSADYFLNTRPSSYAGSVFDLQISGPNQVQWSYRENNNANAISSLTANATVPANVYVYLILTMNLTTRIGRVYIDGTEPAYASQGFAGSPGATTGTTFPLAVGSFLNDTASFTTQGNIEYISFWDGIVLTPTEASDWNDIAVARIGTGYLMDGRVTPQVIDPVYPDNGVIGSIYQ